MVIDFFGCIKDGFVISQKKMWSHWLCVLFSHGTFRKIIHLVQRIPRGHTRVGMGSGIVAEQHMSQQTVMCLAATCLPFYTEVSPISTIRSRYRAVAICPQSAFVAYDSFICKSCTHTTGGMVV